MMNDLSTHPEPLQYYTVTSENWDKLLAYHPSCRNHPSVTLLHIWLQKTTQLLRRRFVSNSVVMELKC